MIFVAVFFISTLAVTAQAQEYAARSAEKLGRGLADTTLGWTEVFKSQEKITDKHGLVAGIFWGTTDGLVNSVKRTATGLGEIATFGINNPESVNEDDKPEFPLTNNRAGYRPKNYEF